MSTPTSDLRSLIMQLASDPEFARVLREDPERAAAVYGISAEDLEKLRSVRVEGVARAPRKLEERLSRSALFFGGEAHTAAHDSGDSGSGSHDSGDSGSSSHDSGDSGSNSHDSGDSGSNSHDSDGSGSHDSDGSSSHDSSGSKSDDASSHSSAKGDGKHDSGSGSDSSVKATSGSTDPGSSSESSHTTSSEGSDSSPQHHEDTAPSTAAGTAPPSSPTTTPPITDASPANGATTDPGPSSAVPDPSSDAGPGGSHSTDAPPAVDAQAPGWSAEPGHSTTANTHQPADTPAAAPSPGGENGAENTHPSSSGGNDATVAPAPADHVGQTVAPVMAPAAVMAPTSVMPGAAVDTHANGTYHGGALTQRDVVRADGTTVREVTYADGSGNTREISTGADGFDTQTWHEPDGTEVTYHSGLDGVMRIAVAPDDSSSILTWGGDTPDQAHLVDTHYAADGGAVTSTTTWTGAQDRAPGGTVFTIETPQPDGTTMRTDVTATVHGGAFASTSAGDEAQTVTTTRLAVEDVHNADGTTTRVFSGFPDGHTDAFTFDHYGRAIFHEVDAGPARPVLFGNTLDNEGYHGGLIAHHDTATMIDGTKTTQLTYADGTSVDALITVSAGPDGSEHWTETHTESDGTEISIDRGPDGAFRDAHPIDGTRTTQFTSGTMLDEVAYDAGGNPTATTHWDASPHATGGTLFTVTTPAGDAHRDVETTVNALPGGGAVASTSTYVGDALTTTYTRLDVDETPNDDGTTTYFYRGFPDGRTEAFTVDASGNAVFHQTTPGEPGRPLFVNPYVNQGFHGGLVESREHVVGEPGSRQVTSVDYVYGDGHTETGEVTEHADGSRTVTILGDDGSEKTLDDGTRNVVDLQGVRNSQSYAGTHLEDTTWATDGTTVTNETTWDGPMDPPSGSLMYQTWQNNADGTSAYSGVVATPDGGAAYYGLSADGSGAISVRLSVDTIENPDGSVTKVYDGFPDGHTDSFTFSVTGSPIYHESAPGTPPDVPHGSPLFNEGYRGGLIGQQDIDTAPDGSTTLQLTYADGTVLEGHRTVDADGWPTTVTTAPDGTLVSDYSAGDHGTVTTVGADGSSYQTWSGSGLDDVRFGVDGAHLATTHWDAPNSGLAPGQPMFDITEPRADGTTLTTKVVATDGGAEAYVSDGTVGGLRTTVRLEVTVVPNVDGTLTQIYSGYPDGHTDAFTFDVDGHPVYHQSDPAPDEPETGSLAVGETPRTETAHGAEPTAATSTAAPTTSTPAAQATAGAVAATGGNVLAGTATQATPSTSTTGTATPATTTTTTTTTPPVTTPSTTVTGAGTTAAPSTSFPTTGAGTPAASSAPILLPGGQHGGDIGTRVVTVNDDGSTELIVTRADGTSVEVHRMIDSDGHTVDTYQEADGSFVVSEVGPDAGHTTITGPDGSSVVFSWEGTTLREADTSASGVTTEFAWNSTMQGTPGQELFSTRLVGPDVAGVSTSIQPTADGGAIAVATDTVGNSSTTRLSVSEIPNADGSHTRVFGFPDGHAEAFTFDVDGTPVGHETLPAAPSSGSGHGAPPGTEGSAEHAVPDQHDRPAGRWEQDLRAAVADALQGRTTTQHGDAYSELITGVAGVVAKAMSTGTAGGASGEQAAAAIMSALHLGGAPSHTDATPSDAIHNGVPPAEPPGLEHATTPVVGNGGTTPATHAVVTTGEDGSRVETTTSDDGSTHVVTHRTDGSVESTVTDAASGRVVETTVDTDGSLTVIDTRADGSHVLTQQDAAGGRSVEATTADGSTASQTSYADGTWDLSQSDASTGHQLTKSLGADGTVTYTDTAADGSSIYVRHDPDGAIHQTATAVDGVVTKSDQATDGTGDVSRYDPATGHTVTRALDAQGTLTQTDAGPERTVSVATHQDGTQVQTTTDVATAHTVTATKGTDGILTQVDQAPDGSWTKAVVTPSQAPGVTATMQVTTSAGALINATTYADGHSESSQNDPTTNGHSIFTTKSSTGVVTQSDTAPDQSWTTVVMTPSTEPGVTSTSHVTTSAGITVDVTTYADGRSASSQVQNGPDGHVITTDTAVDKIVTQTDKAPDGSWTTSVTNPTGDGQIVATVHTTTSDGRVIDTDVWYDGTRQSHENDAFTQGHAVTKEMGAGDSYLRISDKAPDGTRSTTEVVGSQTTIDTFRPDKSSTHIDMVSAEEFTRIDTDPDGNWVNFHREPGQPDIRTTYTKATGAVVPVTLPEKIGTIRQASTIDTGAGPDPLVDGVRPVTAAAVPTVAVTASFLEVPTALGGPGTQEAPAPAPSAFAPFAAPAGGTAPGVPTLPSAAGLAHAPQQAMDLAMQQLDRPLAGAQHAADQAIGTVTDLPGTAQKTVDGLTHDAQKTVDGLTTTVTDLPGQAQKTVTDLTTTVTDLPGQAQKTVDGFAHQIDVFGRQASNTITEASDLLSHPGHLIDRGEQAAEHALDRFDVNDAATAGRTALDQLVGTETYRAAFDEYLGWRGSIEGSTTVGGVTLAGGMSASLGLGASGSLTATVGPGGVAAAVAAHAYIGADGEAHGMIDAGLVGAGGAVQAHAGAVADVNARGSAGLDGAKADVGLSAWTGADAGGSAKADLGVATGSAGGHVGTGLGVKLNAGADLSFDKIGVRFDVGAALGIGAEWSADLSVNPSKIVTGVAEIITHPADDLKAIGGAASDVGDFALHAGDTIGSGLGDAAEWTAHAVGDVGDAVIDGGGEVLHTVGKVLPWNW